MYTKVFSQFVGNRRGRGGMGEGGWERGMGEGGGKGAWERGVGEGSGRGGWERGVSKFIFNQLLGKVLAHATTNT